METNLSNEELKMIEKGQKHWDMDVLNKEEGGYVRSETINYLINQVIENTWVQAKNFYENKI